MNTLQTWRNFFLRWRAPLAPFVATILIFYSFRAIYRETRSNQNRRDDILESISRVENAQHFSPILILVRREYYPFAYAVEAVRKHPGDRYWVIVDTIDPTIGMNYFVYPKELYMSVETQTALFRKLLALDITGLKHLPPKDYEKVVVFDSRRGIWISDEWDGRH